MIFEWDSAKNEANIAKHGIDFSNAPLCFKQRIVRWRDKRFDYGESRWIGLAKLIDVTVVVVFTLRNDLIRIISLRRANKRERKVYQERIGDE